jgi:hypothetical protein
MDFIVYGVLAIAAIVLFLKILDVLSALLWIGAALTVIAFLAGGDAWLNFREARAFLPDMGLGDYAGVALQQRRFDVSDSVRRAVESATREMGRSPEFREIQRELARARGRMGM